MKKRSILLIILTLPIFSCSKPRLINLKGEEIQGIENKTVLAIWPPDTEGIDISIPETAKPCNKRFYNIHNPNLTVFKPDNPSGTAIVLCPGGGFNYVASGVEGDPVAERLNQAGMTVFVLKYRLPNTPGADYDHPVPLSDVQRSIQLVRYHAKSFNINPDKIGVMGFSAGGFLASAVGVTRVGPGKQSDAIDKVECDPNFRVLVYTGMTADVMDALKDYCPTLLVHAKDDASVKPENSNQIYEALKALDIPVAFKLYESGGHGFGAGRPGTDSMNWIDDCIAWLRTMDY